MNDSSNPLSVSNDRPLDPLTTEILTVIDETLRKLECPWMLVGATARDLLLVHVFGMHVTRATRDVDFGIAVESWEQFSAVRTAILAAGRFTEDSRTTHRLLYRSPNSEHPIPVDFIPFGGIADPEGRIAWPPDADFVMNVSGFTEALGDALRVRVNERLTVPVVSLAGLAILKLIAWNERRSDKDATDFHRILSSYGDAGNADRLYDEEAAVLEQEEFDFESAGAFLLGRDASAISTKATRRQVLALLSDKSVLQGLTFQMLGPRGHMEDAFAGAAGLLDRFIRGLVA
jgi:predicted nucleotidyltransferase